MTTPPTRTASLISGCDSNRGAHCSAREDRKADRFDLIQIAASPVRYQTDGAERLVGGTHHFAEYGRGRRIVQVLKDHNGRPWQLGERRRLFGDAGIHVAERGAAAERNVAVLA